jgi:hypothetical protein
MYKFLLSIFLVLHLFSYASACVGGSKKINNGIILESEGIRTISDGSFVSFGQIRDSNAISKQFDSWNQAGQVTHIVTILGAKQQLSVILKEPAI